MPDTGTYVYAITRDTDAPGSAGLTGVAGTPVRTVADAGLVAYVSTVPLDRFGEEPLRRSLEDLDWVSEMARAHHRVVEAVAGTAPTAPVRLVTVYGGDEQVRELLRDRRKDFTALLSQVAGRSEWGVKAYARRETAPPPGEEAAGAAGSDSPGIAYLKRRRRACAAGRTRGGSRPTRPSTSTPRWRPSPSRTGGTGPRTRACPAARRRWCSTAPTSSTTTAAASSPPSSTRCGGRGPTSS